ncbi:MAG TPA: hypothetical protein VFE24_10730 [Pirellulales bacterium]|nr:hypothetical protein [Pirellulales bacterium]
MSISSKGDSSRVARVVVVCARSLGRGGFARAAGALLLFAFLLAVPRFAPAQQEQEYEQPPIHYAKPPFDDAASHLKEQLEKHALKLPYDDKFGYLPALLKQFHISATSQALVFSKTSFQRSKISPQSPRALYFNDDTYLGYCLRGDVIEVSAIDSQQGALFFTMSQHPEDACELVRQTDSCLQCHATSTTNDVPGLLIRSIFPDATGMPALSHGTYHTTDRSPFSERWGGWYVTGTHGKLRHMGNVVLKSASDTAQLDLDAGANITDLSKLFDVSPYLTPHSDLVALLVLEHQVTAHNRLTQANYQGRLALRDEAALKKLDGDHAAPRSPSIQRRFDSAADDLLRCFLFVGEPKLTDPVQGTARFAEYFSALGPKDSLGRSLREFDLQTRLFKYPCSYLIYSASFDRLPAPVLEAFYKKLGEVLAGHDERRNYQHLSYADRRAIYEILSDTKKNLPADWRDLKIQ